VIGSICYEGQDPDIFELPPLTRMSRGGEGGGASLSRRHVTALPLGELSPPAGMSRGEGEQMQSS